MTPYTNREHIKNIHTVGMEQSRVSRMAQAIQDWAAASMFPSRSQGKLHGGFWDRLPLLSWRAAGRVVAGVVQAFGFALVMWLLLAGPGFLADGAGQPPAARVARR